MANIQVDMFEVQLGASLLLQFIDQKNQSVRILADAGVHASGYSVDHVHKKLKKTFSAFGDDSQRIDLIIGTHYDADHLTGLVPIIEDHSIEIGEAWMPPVANDTETYPSDSTVAEYQMLAHQLYQSDEGEVLAHYLQKKDAQCKEYEALALSAQSQLQGNEVGKRLPWAVQLDSKNYKKYSKEYFQLYLEAGEGTHTHADEDITESEEDSKWRAFNFGARFRYLRRFSSRLYSDEYLSESIRFGSESSRADYYKKVWSANSELASAHLISLAYLKKSAAKDAINAIALSDVVVALRKRKIPIRCQYINDGEPIRYRWDASKRSFIASERLASEGPELQLLGPSRGLIRKHRDRLPVSASLATLAYSLIPIKSITPSNQLSYVVKLTDQNQGILISGDAGCVDFKEKGRSYYPQLLKALNELHVIQVAHHGGNNGHFYRVLLEAGYAEQTAPSLLLLSHATKDKHRPSDEFAMFIANARKPGDDMKLLFTSQPLQAKVQNYEELIHPVVGPPNDVGDIQIRFDGQGWRVKKHAVKV